MKKIIWELEEFLEMLESDKEDAPVFLANYIKNISKDLTEIIEKYREDEDNV